MTNHFAESRLVSCEQRVFKVAANRLVSFGKHFFVFS